MSYLLDTNVVSEIRKSSGDERVAAWSRGIPPTRAYLSVVTIFEIERGIQLLGRRDPTQASVLRSWLDRELIPSYTSRILSLDIPTMSRAAGIHVPDPRPERDAFIAATALVHGLTVVTRNTGDFEPMGVRTFNPWKYRN